MNLITRIKSIFSANMNAALDSIEDPEKMIDQYIREAEAALGTITARTADVIVVTKNCQKRVQECEDNIANMNSKAEQAFKEKCEEDGQEFIRRRLAYEEQLEGLKQAAENASQNEAKMREMHSKLMTDLKVYKEKRDTLKAKMAVVHTSEDMANYSALSNKASASFGSFNRMEEKINTMVERTNALVELNSEQELSDGLCSKYDQGAASLKLTAAVADFKKEHNIA